jgi:hypothetical protein
VVGKGLKGQMLVFSNLSHQLVLQLAQALLQTPSSLKHSSFSSIALLMSSSLEVFFDLELEQKPIIYRLENLCDE